MFLTKTLLNYLLIHLENGCTEREKVDRGTILAAADMSLD